MAVLSRQTYRYSPLSGDSIRLLRILSGPGEPIRCSLEDVQLRDEPLYDCLSYTWGDPLYHELSAPQDTRITTAELKFPITCDGLVIFVAENLLEALLQLSRNGTLSATDDDQHHKPCRIWIDAVCIDQGNVLERNSQVAMMNRIYRSAQTVIVWLGISDVHTEHAIDVMSRLSSIPQENRDVSLPLDLDDPEMYQALGITDIEPQQWLDYAAFLKRTWFSRIWVIQETSVARNIVVFCGSHVLLWSDITNAANLLRETQLGELLMSKVVEAIDSRAESTRYIPNTLTNPFIFENVRVKATSLNLEKLLVYSRYFNASDDRDRVFAILGLWEQALEHKKVPDHIHPDYQLSVEQVYTTAARATVRETGDINLLSLVEDSSFRKLPDLPSWVPDYTVTPQPHQLIDNLRAAPDEKRWNAGGGLPFTAPIQTNSLLLPVDGIQVDTITSFAATEAEIMDEYQLKSLLQLLTHVLDHPFPNCSSPIEAFWRTLIKDTYRGHPAAEEAQDAFPLFITMRVWEIEQELHNVRDNIEYSDPPPGPFDNLSLKFAKLSDIYAQTKAVICSLSTHPDTNGIIPTWDTIQKTIEIGQYYNDNEVETPEKKQLDRDFDAIGESFRIAYSGRRLFLTNRNYVGIAAQSLQKDDAVWVLAGSTVPLVLRRLPNGNWKLVGEAYVHSLMNGEAVRDDYVGLERVYLE
jgi:hypothetical protein